MRKTLTNAGVVAAFTTIDRVLATAEGLPVGAVQLPLIRSHKALRGLAEDVEDARKTIVATYVTPGDADAVLDDAAVVAANAELTELADAEVEVELHVPDLSSVGDAKIAVGDLYALVVLFEDA